MSRFKHLFQCIKFGAHVIHCKCRQPSRHAKQTWALDLKCFLEKMLESTHAQPDNTSIEAISQHMRALGSVVSKVCENQRAQAAVSEQVAASLVKHGKLLVELSSEQKRQRSTLEEGLETQRELLMGASRDSVCFAVDADTQKL